MLLNLRCVFYWGVPSVTYFDIRIAVKVVSWLDFIGELFVC